MKKLFTVLSLVLLLSGLCACASDKETEKEEAIDLSGKWLLIRVDAEENGLSEEDLQSLHEVGLDILLTLEKDGTGTFDLLSDVYDVTYDVKEMTLYMYDNSVDMRYEDGLLYLSEEGSEMVLERLPEE